MNNSKIKYSGIFVFLVSVIFLFVLSFSLINKKNNEPIISGSESVQISTEPEVVLKPEIVAEDLPDLPARPILANVTPTNGQTPLNLKIVGRNLRGFEGDIHFYLENKAGQKAVILVQENSVTQTSTGDQQVEFEVKQQMCTEILTYKGGECSSFLIIEPGMYKIYTAPWGQKSNKFDFIVTPNKCSSMSESQCSADSACRPVYGPSACDGTTCTTDLVFNACLQR
jgi:hypothetical protein